ncbi:hypothetical protein K1T71_000060 [Dendrolimus kikuchii]|uniref:Uncharacterized protein n=1 Tax=Dendrolimus kikuchii TaxID=765133 RepID=A0ACC1DJP6_9NEOP|nr:hypothetical protein K1T71_000060 [Dendrolimus kikuchii]
MGDSSDFQNSVDTSGSDFEEEEVLKNCEQQVNPQNDNQSLILGTKQKNSEKRNREDSEEATEDDNGFVTVRRRHKRFLRSMSRSSSKSGEEKMESGRQVEGSILPQDSLQGLNFIRLTLKVVNGESP